MGAPGSEVWRETEKEEKTCPEVEGQQVCEIQGGFMVMKKFVALVDWLGIYSRVRSRIWLWLLIVTGKPP